MKSCSTKIKRRHYNANLNLAICPVPYSSNTIVPPPISQFGWHRDSEDTTIFTPQHDSSSDFFVDEGANLFF
jgi:hypothetical protein